MGLNVFDVQFTTPPNGVLPNATQFASYTPPYTLTASSPNGGPYIFNGCCLPQGMTLLSNGVISGTPTGGPGKYGFNITAKDGVGATYNKNLSIDVLAPSGSSEPLPQIRPYGNLDDWAIGIGLSRGIGVCCGGTAPFTWNITGLPAGLDFRSEHNSAPHNGPTLPWINPGDVEIWGAPGPGTIGQHNITLTVTDANGLTATQQFTLSVSAIWLDNFLPNGQAGVPYSQTFHIVGGVGSYAATELPSNNFPGRLPDGLNQVGPGLLTISGTPLEGGNFNQLFKFTDSATPTPNTLSLTQYPYIAPVSGAGTTWAPASSSTRCLSDGDGEDVKTMIGVPTYAGRCKTARRTSRPSMRGRARSMMIASGGPPPGDSSARSAASPSLQTLTSAEMLFS